MKQSYYTTPRRSEDCTYHSWADPIHVDDTSTQHDPDRVVVVTCIVIAIALVVFAAAGWLA